jgi:hypothetical protein
MTKMQKEEQLEVEHDVAFVSYNNNNNFEQCQTKHNKQCYYKRGEVMKCLGTPWKILPLFMENDVEKQLQLYCDKLPYFKFDNKNKNNNNNNNNTCKSSSMDNNDKEVTVSTFGDNNLNDNMNKSVAVSIDSNCNNVIDTTTLAKCQSVIRLFCNSLNETTTTTRTTTATRNSCTVSSRHNSSNNYQKIHKLLLTVVIDDLYCVYAIIASMKLIVSCCPDVINRLLELSNNIMMKQNQNNNSTNINNGSYNNYDNNYEQDDYDDDDDDIDDNLSSTSSLAIKNLLHLCWKECFLNKKKEENTTSTSTNDSNLFISKIAWIRLVQYVYRNMYIIDASTNTTSTLHPLHTYATTIIPKLSQQELMVVATVLSLQLPSKSLSLSSSSSTNSNSNNMEQSNQQPNEMHISPLAIMKQVQDLINNNNSKSTIIQNLNYAVLIENPLIVTEKQEQSQQNQETYNSKRHFCRYNNNKPLLVHSCIPTTSLSFSCRYYPMFLQQKQPQALNFQNIINNRKNDDEVISKSKNNNTVDNCDDCSTIPLPRINLISLFDTPPPATSSTSTTVNISSKRSNRTSTSTDIDLVLQVSVPTVCTIQDDESVEVREARVIRRTGGRHSCACLRCKFEAVVVASNDDDNDDDDDDENIDSDYRNNTNSKKQSALYNINLIQSVLGYQDGNDNNSISITGRFIHDLVQLGRFYLGRGKVKKARDLYQYAFNEFEKKSSSYNESATGVDTYCRDSINKQVFDDYTIADIIHALGACYLSMNQFRKAQQVWNDYGTKYSSICQKHSGLVLQLDKIIPYSYTDSKENNVIIDNNISTHPSTTTSIYYNNNIIQYNPIVSNTSFIATNVVSSMICQNIIKIAESSQHGWTKERHYAVPTYDIPIHTNAKLLNWFVNEFWLCTMKPLLLQQFSTATNFFIHDAFCVRYDATKDWNHLPIRTCINVVLMLISIFVNFTTVCYAFLKKFILYFFCCLHVLTINADTDESTHSFVLALNDDYEGGGTYFYHSARTVKLKTGEVLSFRGDTIEHGGEAVTKGTRYLVVAFLYAEASNVEYRNNKTMARKKREKLENDEPHGCEAKQPRNDFSFCFLP